MHEIRPAAQTPRRAARAAPVPDRGRRARGPPARARRGATAAAGRPGSAPTAARRSTPNGPPARPGLPRRSGVVRAQRGWRAWKGWCWRNGWRPASVRWARRVRQGGPARRLAGAASPDPTAYVRLRPAAAEERAGLRLAGLQRHPSPAQFLCLFNINKRIINQILYLKNCFCFFL